MSLLWHEQLPGAERLTFNNIKIMALRVRLSPCLISFVHFFDKTLSDGGYNKVLPVGTLRGMPMKV